MQLTALRNLDGSEFAQDVLHALGERLADVAAVAEHASDLRQRHLAARQCGQGALAIGHFGRGH